MAISNLTPEQLRTAADLMEKIGGLQNELNQLLGDGVPAPFEAATAEAPQAPRNGRRKRRVSTAHRKALSLAAKARWAKARAARDGTL
jgi:hypothetical protein